MTQQTVTESQAKFIQTLVGERVWPTDWSITPADALARVENGDLSKTGASTVITRLLNQPRIVKETAAPQVSALHNLEAAADDVPEGRYAVKDASGDWLFYQVQKPAKGKWAGWTFVKRLVGAPGSFIEYPVKGKPAREATLLAIRTATYQDVAEDGTVRDLAGPEAATVAFAREHKVCAICLSDLSDPKSLARGIGPVCARRFDA